MRKFDFDIFSFNNNYEDRIVENVLENILDQHGSMKIFFSQNLNDLNYLKNFHKSEITISDQEELEDFFDLKKGVKSGRYAAAVYIEDGEYELLGRCGNCNKRIRKTNRPKIDCGCEGDQYNTAPYLIALDDFYHTALDPRSFLERTYFEDDKYSFVFSIEKKSTEFVVDTGNQMYPAGIRIFVEYKMLSSFLRERIHFGG